MWTFPTTPQLTDVTSRLAKVLTGTCAKYLLGAELLPVRLSTRGAVADIVDASMWRVENTLLVIIVNAAHQDITGSVTLRLPAGMAATSITSMLWGDGKWQLTHLCSTTQTQSSGLRGLSSDILLLDMKPQQVVGGQDVITVQ